MKTIPQTSAAPLTEQDIRDMVADRWPHATVTDEQVACIVRKHHQYEGKVEILGPAFQGVFALKAFGMFIGVEPDGYAHT